MADTLTVTTERVDDIPLLLAQAEKMQYRKTHSGTLAAGSALQR